MANNKAVPTRPMPRLYLATPVVDDPSALAAKLGDALAAADVAAVLLRLKPVDQRTMITRVKTLAPIVQSSGAALLLDGNIELVARGGADGAHVSGIEAFGEASASLKPDRIAGVGGLITRHDSMSAGEAGADYVLFGEPDAMDSGPRPRQSPSACNGGPNCSNRPASAFRRESKRRRSSPPPGPISFWSAISSGRIRVEP